MANIILSEEEYNELIKIEDMYKRLLDKNERAEAHIKNLKHQLEETQRKIDRDSKVNINVKSKLLTERDELRNDRNSWRDRYYELRYALRKDETLDESISCVRDIPSDVEMIEDLKKRAVDFDYYKEKSELLEVRCHEAETDVTTLNSKVDILEKKLKKANELADSWKKDYERLRNQFIYPIYNILYPDNPERNINVTDFLNDIKDLKVYSDENGQMYKELQEWKEKCHKAETDITILNSKVEVLDKRNTNQFVMIGEKDKKISELEARRSYWEKRAIENAADLQKTKNDRDEWRELYNSLSEICSDYDKRCKEECEKKYRDEITKLQNIVTEKHVEIKGLKKDIINLSYDRRTIESMSKKNTKLNQTISDQEITIKALLITIKEMCKEDETDA